MRTLPLLVPTPDEPALLPFERRRLDLVEPRMLTAARLSSRNDGELILLAWETAGRKGLALDEGEPTADRLLPVGTRCTVLEATLDGEGGSVLLRGIERVQVAPIIGACHDHHDPYTEGTESPFEAVTDLQGSREEWEAAWQEAVDRLEKLSLFPRLRSVPLLEKIDRLAAWLAPPPWVAGEILSLADPRKRLFRLVDHAKEMASPGASFRPDDADLPFSGEEEYFADRVMHYASRARAVATFGHARRRQAARLRMLASATRLERRIAASAQAGNLPVLEQLTSEHGLGVEAIDALLVAGLGSHDRFAETLEKAARLLPPGELPLNAWIAALESRVFPAP